MDFFFKSLLISIFTSDLYRKEEAVCHGGRMPVLWPEKF
jgi:hypothetical protein